MKKDSSQNKSGIEKEKVNSNGHHKDYDSEIKKNSGKTLKDVFEEELKDIYGAEKQILKMLPEILKEVHTEELKKVMKDHLEETRNQIVRLDQVFEKMAIVDELRLGLVVLADLLDEGRLANAARRLIARLDLDIMSPSSGRKKMILV